MCPVDSATVIDVGDFLWLDTDDAKPASAQADAGTEAGNQEAFHDNFLGIALQASASGQTNPIMVQTRGVRTYTCPSGTWELGDLVGVDEAPSGLALLDQQVAGVAGENLSIGRVVQREGSAVTSVRVHFVSSVIHGGLHAVA
jgi:hypothetical protein